MILQTFFVLFLSGLSAVIAIQLFVVSSLTLKTVLANVAFENYCGADIE